MQRNLTRNLPQLARHFSRNNKNSASSMIEIPLVRTLFSRRCWIPDPYLENRTREMERYFDRLERDSGFGSNFLKGRFTSPLSGNLYSFFNFPVAIESQVSSGENGKPGKYTLQLELGTHFSPDDIKLTLKERHLTIEAKLKIKSDDGSSKVFQEIHRQYDLPEGIKPEEVKCFVTNGVVSIEAPLEEVEPPQPKEIPITINK